LGFSLNENKNSLQYNIITASKSNRTGVSRK
jgi:hypothetical protein